MKVSRFRAETLMIDGLAPIAYFGIRVRIMKRRVRMVVVKVVVVCILKYYHFCYCYYYNPYPALHNPNPYPKVCPIVHWWPYRVVLVCQVWGHSRIDGWRLLLSGGRRNDVWHWTPTRPHPPGSRTSTHRWRNVPQAPSSSIAVNEKTSLLSDFCTSQIIATLTLPLKSVSIIWNT